MSAPTCALKSCNWLSSFSSPLDSGASRLVETLVLSLLVIVVLVTVGSALCGAAVVTKEKDADAALVSPVPVPHEGREERDDEDEEDAVRPQGARQSGACEAAGNETVEDEVSGASSEPVLKGDGVAIHSLWSTARTTFFFCAN